VAKHVRPIEKKFAQQEKTLSMNGDYSHFHVNCSASMAVHCSCWWLHVWVLASASKSSWTEHRSVLRTVLRQHFFTALLPLACDWCQSKHSCCANVGGGTPVFLWLNTNWHFQQDPSWHWVLKKQFRWGKIHWFDARSHKWGSKKLKMINICTTK